MGKNQIIAELREENQRLAVNNLDAYEVARESNAKVGQITKQRDEYNEIAVNMTTKLVTLANEKVKLEKELVNAKAELGREKAKRLISEKDAEAIRNDEYNAHREATLRDLAIKNDDTSRLLRNLFGFSFNGSNDHANALKTVFDRLQKAESERNDYKSSLKAVRIALGFNEETTVTPVIKRIEEMKGQIDTQKGRLHRDNILLKQQNDKIADLANAEKENRRAYVNLVTENESLVDRNRVILNDNDSLKDSYKATLAVNELVNLVNTNLLKENDRLSSLVHEAETRLLDLWCGGNGSNKFYDSDVSMSQWLAGWVEAFGYKSDNTDDPNYVTKAIGEKRGTPGTKHYQPQGSVSKNWT